MRLLASVLRKASEVYVALKASGIYRIDNNQKDGAITAWNS